MERGGAMAGLRRRADCGAWARYSLGMQSHASTVAEYLDSLPEDRRQAVEAVRRVVLEHLPAGYAEGMQYGMIGYFVPHELYPAGYHCDPRQPLPYIGLASQKQYLSLYLMGLYMDEAARARFEAAWARSGAKKLDAGKSCIRFKKVEDLALDVIGASIAAMPVAEYVRLYEAGLGARAGSARKQAGKAKAGATKKVGSAKAGAKKKVAAVKAGEKVGKKVAKKADKKTVKKVAMAGSGKRATRAGGGVVKKGRG